MSKPVLGLILGAVLGVLDGLTSLFYPEVAGQLMIIVIGSTFKGLIAGMIIGLIARKVRSIPWGLIVGLVVAFLVTLPFAIAEDPNTGQVYFFEIIIPGSLLGVIVGYATQKYGAIRQKSAA